MKFSLRYLFSEEVPDNRSAMQALLQGRECYLIGSYYNNRTTVNFLLSALLSRQLGPILDRSRLHDVLHEMEILMSKLSSKKKAGQSDWELGLLLIQPVVFSDLIEEIKAFDKKTFILYPIGKDNSSASITEKETDEYLARVPGIISNFLEKKTRINLRLRDWSKIEITDRVATKGSQTPLQERISGSNYPLRNLVQIVYRRQLIEDLEKLLRDVYPKPMNRKKLMNLFSLTPREIIDSFIRSVVIHHTTILATEDRALLLPPRENIREDLYHLTMRALNNDNSIFYIQSINWKTNPLLRLQEWFNILMGSMDEDKVFARQVYTDAFELVTGHMLFTSSGSGEDNQPLIMAQALNRSEYNRQQRDAFLEFFQPPKEEKYRRDIAEWLISTINDFRYWNDNSKDSSVPITSGVKQYFGQKGFESFIKGSVYNNSEDSIGDNLENFNKLTTIDKKVLSGYCVLDYIFPVLRHIDPHVNSAEFAAENDFLLKKYEKFYQFLKKDIQDFGFDRWKYYLAIGDFIKATYRNQGRWEVLGFSQRLLQALRRIRSKAWRWFLSYTGYRKNITFFKISENKRSQKEIKSAVSAIEKLVDSCVDKKGSKSGLYDGPVYLTDLFRLPLKCDGKEPYGNLLENMLAMTLVSNSEKGVDRIVGVGRKGSVVGSMLSLLLKIPFSSVTLNSSVDLSPSLATMEEIFCIPRFFYKGLGLHAFVDWWRGRIPLKWIWPVKEQDGNSSTRPNENRYNWIANIFKDRLLIIDDVIKTGFTLSQVIEELESERNNLSSGIIIEQCQALFRINVTDFSNLPFESLELANQFKEMKNFLEGGKQSECGSFIRVNRNKELAVLNLKPPENCDEDCLYRVELDRKQLDNDHVKFAPLESHINEIINLFKQHVDESSKWMKKIGIDKARKKLQAKIKASTYTGLPHKFTRANIRMYLNPLKIPVILIYCIEKIFALFAFRFNSMFSESVFNLLKSIVTEPGAKYKPSYLFLNIDFLWRIGAYFHRVLLDLDEEKRPNVLLINTSVVIPFAISLCFHGRYAKASEQMNFHIVMVKGYAEKITGLNRVVKHLKEKGERELRIASISAKTIRGKREAAIWDRIHEQLKPHNKNEPTEKFSAKKSVTFSLYNISYHHRSKLKKAKNNEYKYEDYEDRESNGSLPEWCGQFVPLVDLER